jgi:hypothetical protein
MEQLRGLVRDYRDADNRVRELNTRILELRKQRQDVEGRITVLLANPEFAGIDKLKVSDDNSLIRIKRPEQWYKPWSISKTKLKESIVAYFTSTTNPTADGCYEFIAEEQRQSLVSHEFSLERVTTD